MANIRLNRKKVMKLASKFWAASKAGYEACIVLLDEIYGKTYAADQVAGMARRLASCSSWGAVQSLTWKAAKFHLRKRIEFWEAVKSDPLYVGHYYTEPVKGWKPSPMARYTGEQRPVELVVYTQKYGRLVLDKLGKELIPSHKA